MTTTQSTRDEAYMDQALALADRGRGQTSPNPMVGAVVVSPRGVVVGTGFHERAGKAHAEVRALDEAAAWAQNATLYCTLEPCAHAGRTGPCASRIVEAGVSRVVIGIGDPNPRVNGAGIAYPQRTRAASRGRCAAVRGGQTQPGVPHVDHPGASLRDHEDRNQSRRVYCGAAGCQDAHHLRGDRCGGSSHQGRG